MGNDMGTPLWHMHFIHNGQVHRTVYPGSSVPSGSRLETVVHLHGNDILPWPHHGCDIVTESKIAVRPIPDLLPVHIYGAVHEHPVKFDKENKPGISNLLTIYASIKGMSIEEAEKQFATARYGEFKKAVADAVIEEIGPFQERYKQIRESGEYLAVLREGAQKAKQIAHQTLKRVQNAVGLLNIDEL